jgi:hypothetical protein
MGLHVAVAELQNGKIAIRAICMFTFMSRGHLASFFMTIEPSTNPNACQGKVRCVTPASGPLDGTPVVVTLPDVARLAASCKDGARVAYQRRLLGRQPGDGTDHSQLAGIEQPV